MEHTIASAEAATEAAAEATTSEKVILIVKHAKASERIAPAPSPLLLLLLSLLSLLATAAAHVSKVIIEKVLERVLSTKERPKDVIGLRKSKSTTASATAEALEEGGLATEAAPASATT